MGADECNDVCAREPLSRKLGDQGGGVGAGAGDGGWVGSRIVDPAHLNGQCRARGTLCDGNGLDGELVR